MGAGPCNHRTAEVRKPYLFALGPGSYPGPFHKAVVFSRRPDWEALPCFLVAGGKVAAEGDGVKGRVARESVYTVPCSRSVGLHVQHP